MFIPTEIMDAARLLEQSEEDEEKLKALMTGRIAPYDLADDAIKE